VDRAIEAGELEPGGRLPTHRELAEHLGVAVTTVTRAYREARKRGLVTGQVGRGTFVRSPEGESRARGSAARADLTQNSLEPRAFASDLERLLSRLSESRMLSDLFDYQPAGGMAQHRDACARWLTAHRFEVPRDRVLISAGGQHAMTVAVSSLARAGNLVLTGDRTCYGIQALARQLGLRLRGVSMDDEGVLPDALDDACAEEAPAALYVMPTMQNPLGLVMSEARRKQIAEVANRRGLRIVEDDAYGFLDVTPPLCTFAPELTTYIASMGKLLWPGVRIGLVVAPHGASPQRLEGAIGATTLQAAPWTAAVVAESVDSGLAERVLVWKTERLRSRGEAVRAVLPERATGSHPMSPHIWIPLPHLWKTSEFVACAEERGISVTPGDDFAIARSAVEPAIRVCIGALPGRSELVGAATVLADLLANAPPPRAASAV
jgi:DNA-binding transcriptional MocR family regulator